jgi:hypothetical protein
LNVSGISQPYSWLVETRNCLIWSPCCWIKGFIGVSVDEGWMRAPSSSLMQWHLLIPSPRLNGHSPSMRKHCRGREIREIETLQGYQAAPGKSPAICLPLLLSLTLPTPGLLRFQADVTYFPMGCNNGVRQQVRVEPWSRKGRQAYTHSDLSSSRRSPPRPAHLPLSLPPPVYPFNTC